MKQIHFKNGLHGLVNEKTGDFLGCDQKCRFCDSFWGYCNWLVTLVL